MDRINVNIKTDRKDENHIYNHGGAFVTKRWHEDNFDYDNLNNKPYCEQRIKFTYDDKIGDVIDAGPGIRVYRVSDYIDPIKFLDGVITITSYTNGEEKTESILIKEEMFNFDFGPNGMIGIGIESTIIVNLISEPVNMGGISMEPGVYLGEIDGVLHVDSLEYLDITGVYTVEFVQDGSGNCSCNRTYSELKKAEMSSAILLCKYTNAEGRKFTAIHADVAAPETVKFIAFDIGSGPEINDSMKVDVLRVSIDDVWVNTRYIAFESSND